MRLLRLMPLVLIAALAPAAGGRSHVASQAAQPAVRAGRTARPVRTRLVFAATVAYVRGEPQTQIYSLEPSGRAAAQLTFAAESASAPLPSPDGAHIAFERGGSIWVMRPNGQGQRLLAAHGIEPAWTPDSRRVAYVSITDQNQRLGIRAVGLDGRRDRMLVPGADAGDPAWSPGGKSLAFGRNGSLVVLHGGVQRTVVTRPGVFIERIVWAADGRWLAFFSEDPSDGWSLEVVREDGRRRRDLSGVVIAPAAWSPNRPLLAYVGLGTGPLSTSFRLLNAATGRVQKLADAPKFINSLAWAPSGTSLTFSGGAYLSEDLTAVSELGVITLAGRLRYLDHGVSYPLPEAVAWTTPPAGLRYRPPAPVGPLVSKDGLELREPVEDLVADGDRLAYRICGTIGVWRPGDAKAVPAQVDRPLCGEGNIGFYNLALAGGRVAWGVIQGGIQRSNSLVVEAVGDRATRAVVAGHYQLAGDARGDERAGYLLGAGPLLVFSTWAYCNEIAPVTCPGLLPGQATTIASQTLWRVREPSWPGTCPGIRSDDPSSGRCQQLRVEPGPLRPLDVDAGRIAASGHNATVVLDADGRQLLAVPMPAQAAELAGSDLVVLVPGGLLDYDAATGALLHAWPAPYVSFGGFCGVPLAYCGRPQFRLEDAARGLIVYIAGGPRPAAPGGQIHLLRLTDGRDVVLAAGTAARFGAGGLFYAYQATGAWPGRIRFVPFDELPLR